MRASAARPLRAWIGLERGGSAPLDLVTTRDYHLAMRSVGIKQLKARLSEYVRLARGGEIILVSDRDEVVAELGPVRHQAEAPDSIEALLDRLAARGQVTRAARAKEALPWSPPHLGLGEDAVRELLDDLHGDR